MKKVAYLFDRLTDFYDCIHEVQDELDALEIKYKYNAYRHILVVGDYEIVGIRTDSNYYKGYKTDFCIGTRINKQIAEFVVRSSKEEKKYFESFDDFIKLISGGSNNERNSSPLKS